MRATCEYVYVLEAGPKFKIGIAADPVRRAKNIYSYGMHRVQLVRAWHCPKSARWIENLALNRVKHRREYGEWCAGSGRCGVMAVRWAISRVQSIREVAIPAKANPSRG